MTESITCRQCGTVQPAQQKFCGECGLALREGVTRPLTASERAAWPQRARLGPGPDEPLPPVESPHAEASPLLRVAGLVLLVMLSMAAAWTLGAGRGGLDQPVIQAASEGNPTNPPVGEAAAEATPSEFIQVQRGSEAYLGPLDSTLGHPPVSIGFTRTIVQPSSVPTGCQGAISTVWIFEIVNNGATNANILVDPASVRLVDSTGRVYSGSHQCHLELGETFAAPISLLPGSKSSASVTLDVDALSATATSLDLHMLISGQRFLFHAPLP
jgi:hypothetical protein